MLAKDASLDRLVGLCDDDNFDAGQKVDGHRCLLHIDEGAVVPYSRKKLVLHTRKDLADAFSKFAATGRRWVFDCEYLNRELYVFDLIEAGDVVHPGVPYDERRGILEEFMGQGPMPPFVKLLPVYITPADKRALAKRMLEDHCEGVVFKRRDSKYVVGESDAWLKAKFRRDVDCVVTEVRRGGKSNMVLGVFKPGEDKPTEVGECTANAGDGPRVKVGDVVCVTIQHVSEAFRLVQPTLPKIRTDKLPAECTWDQLPPLQANKTVLTV